MSEHLETPKMPPGLIANAGTWCEQFVTWLYKNKLNFAAMVFKEGRDLALRRSRARTALEEIEVEKKRLELVREWESIRDDNVRESLRPRIVEDDRANAEM